jgi:hypothetical protein
MKLITSLELDARKLSVLELRMLQTVVASEISGAPGDMRRLGMALSGVNIAPLTGFR